MIRVFAGSTSHNFRSRRYTAIKSQRHLNSRWQRTCIDTDQLQFSSDCMVERIIPSIIFKRRSIFMFFKWRINTENTGGKPKCGHRRLRCQRAAKACLRHLASQQATKIETYQLILLAWLTFSAWLVLLAWLAEGAIYFAKAFRHPSFVAWNILTEQLAQHSIWDRGRDEIDQNRHDLTTL